MPHPRNWTRTYLLACAGIASLALPLASIALLVHVCRGHGQPAPGPVVTTPDPPAAAADLVPAAEPEKEKEKNTAKGKRFTLRLGQGFRFQDAVVVAGRPDDAADVVFKYVAPQVGGMSTRYNPISQQVETGLEPTLTSPAPLLLAPHVQAFDTKPNVAKTTSGDIAEYQNQAPIHATTRYLLLMTRSGDQYLLTLDELEAPLGKYDDWRIGFAWERVQLPVGRAGGRISAPLPGKLVFRDWYRVKMILRVDLTTGKEEAIADGILPSTVGERLLGYGDSTGAYVVRDAAGTVLHNVRFDEQVLGPLLAPDGARLAASVYRAGPSTTIGSVTVPGAAVLSTGVFDLDGHELVSFVGYDDPAWTPEGKLVATGSLTNPGLFELDPATKDVRAIDARVTAPSCPAVSPDGTTIAFVTGGKVWLIGRDGKNLRQLLQDGHVQQRPAFSPDGTKVAAVICNTVANDVTGEVFVIDVKSRDVTPLRTSTGMTLVPDTSSRLNWFP